MSKPKENVLNNFTEVQTPVNIQSGEAKKEENFVNTKIADFDKKNLFQAVDT